MVKFANMAFSKGVATSDNTNFKRYIGIGKVRVVAVNPTAEEIKAIYDRSEVGEEPTYLSEYEGTPTCRIHFIVKTVAEDNNGIDTTNTLRFSLRDEYRFNSDKSKVQVIDDYGRTAWAVVNRDITFNPSNPKQFKVLGVPVYANGPADIAAKFRPMYAGEEALEEFIRTQLNLPMTRRYVNGVWEAKTGDALIDCIGVLDNIDSYFKGDFSELKELMTYQPNNAVKLAFGVKTADDGKQYTDFYTGMFLGGNARSTERLAKAIKADKEAGRWPNTEFDVCPLREHTVNATVIGDMPEDIAQPAAANAWFD